MMAPQQLARVLIRRIMVYPILGAGLFFATGILFWGGFNWALEITNTESFCISCHEMRENVYKEYKTTVHYANRTGVRASCPDCHVPREWVHKVARKIRATNELFHWARGSIDTREKFEAKRLFLARQVWSTMAETNSRECRNCHGNEFMAPGAQTKRAGFLHQLATGWRMTCIDCHKGVAHSLPKGFSNDAVMDDIHARMERDKIACRICHQGMAGSGKGWD